MTTSDLKKTQSLLNGRSRSAKIRDDINIITSSVISYDLGCNRGTTPVLQVRYSQKTWQGLEENQCLIGDFEDAVNTFCNQT